MRSVRKNRVFGRDTPFHGVQTAHTIGHERGRLSEQSPRPAPGVADSSPGHLGHRMGWGGVGSLRTGNDSPYLTPVARVSLVGFRKPDTPFLGLELTGPTSSLTDAPRPPNTAPSQTLRQNLLGSLLWNRPRWGQ